MGRTCCGFREWADGFELIKAVLFLTRTFASNVRCMPLLTLIADNRRDAAEIFVHSYGDLVWSIAKGHTNSNEEAEMETNEIFLDIWRSAAKFAASGLSEQAFIYAVARCRLRGLAQHPVEKYFNSFST